MGEVKDLNRIHEVVDWLTKNQEDLHGVILVGLTKSHRAVVTSSLLTDPERTYLCKILDMSTTESIEDSGA